MRITDYISTGSAELDISIALFSMTLTSGIGIAEVAYRTLKKTHQLPSLETSLKLNVLCTIVAIPCSLAMGMSFLSSPTTIPNKFLFFGAYSTAAAAIAATHFFLRRNHFSLFFPTFVFSPPVISRPNLPSQTKQKSSPAA